MSIGTVYEHASVQVLGLDGGINTPTLAGKNMFSVGAEQEIMAGLPPLGNLLSLDIMLFLLLITIIRIQGICVEVVIFPSS